MAILLLCLFAALNFAACSLQATKDPLQDFCRRWGHQTARVDNRLYIDGGLIAWNPLSTNPLNYTNTWLLFSDLNTTTGVEGMPKQHANLTKNSTVPSVSGGILWADEANKCFYLFGGEYQSNPSGFSFWAYDTILNQWNETEYTSNVDSIQRVSYGAGTQIEELGLGFYYGGWLNNRTSPGWTGEPMATTNLIRFDFTSGQLSNNTGPSDNMGRAEGSMVYLPASDGGLLIHFGGVEDPYRNGSFVGANMSTIIIFDISSSKWYKQTAGGSVPPQRRQFCADATWADDHSSYNIYLYGGFGVDPQNVTGFDDVYILSIPSFTWIKAFPTDNNTSVYGHGGCSANVVKRDQMLVIGGWFTDTDGCDAQSGWGQHNMNLGYNGAAKTLWDKYDPDISTYFVPTPILSAIGGGPTGGATVTKPSNWDNPDLAVYFTRVPTFSARTATRTIPTTTGDPTSTGSSSKTNVGAIAGGVVGGLVGLIAILLLILFCLHRRKKARKDGDEKDKATLPPPAELAATSPRQELPSPGTTKYIHMQQPEINAHPAFSGPNSIHSRSPSDHHRQSPSWPPMAYHSTTPTPATPNGSPYHSEFPNQYNYQHPPTFPPYSDNPSAYDTQSSHGSDAYAQPHAVHHQRQHSYPTPTSSTQQSNPLSPSQQVYYPPPPDPSIRHSTDHETPVPPSASHTPAHFYAPPATSPDSPHIDTLAPGTYGGEGASMRGVGHGDAASLSARGSVDSRRRPIRGRFVEVDHM